MQCLPLLFLLVVMRACGDVVFDVTHYGAVGDGVTKDTEASSRHSERGSLSLSNEEHSSPAGRRSALQLRPSRLEAGVGRCCFPQAAPISRGRSTSPPIACSNSRYSCC